MSLALKYCSEVSKNFKLIAVYVPGTSIEIGNIIKFDKNLLNFENRSCFDIYGHIKDYSISYKTKKRIHPGSLSFSSSNSVQVSSNAKVNNIVEYDIEFLSEGGIYLNTYGYTDESIIDIQHLDNAIQEIDYTQLINKYIVTRLITASNAIIMQSSKKGGKLNFEFTLPSNIQIQNPCVSIKQSAGNSLMINNQNVTILMRLRKVEEILKDSTNRREKTSKYAKTGFARRKLNRISSSSSAIRSKELLVDAANEIEGNFQFERLYYNKNIVAKSIKMSDANPLDFFDD